MNKHFYIITSSPLASIFNKTLLSVTLVLAISCTKKEEVVPDQNTPDPVEELCALNIMSYQFGIEHLSVPEQAKTLDSLGMDGILVRVNPNEIDNLGAFYQTHEVLNDSLEIYDVFTYCSLVDDNLRHQQIANIEEIYKQIKFEDTRLQVIFSGAGENPVSAIKEIADIAAEHQKELIIYPHYNTSIETAEEARNYIDSCNRPNVYLAVHLCHELAYGNGNRMDEVVTTLAPYIKSVSISGADINEQSNTSLPNWYWGIKPLYMGTYDYTSFYNALININYDGPMAIHTWGIYNNFGLSPETHLPLSKEVIDTLAKAACK